MSGLSVFFSFSHQDDKKRQRLQGHLAQLEAEGAISSWYDGKILPGEDIDDHVRAQLNSADIVLLLVSPNFMNSSYIRHKELRRAMERHNAGEAFVIPIILTGVDWYTAPFGRLKALPKDGKPIDTWRPQNQALANVAIGMRSLIEQFEMRRAKRSEITDQAVKEALDSSLRLKRLVTVSGSRLEFTKDQLRFSLSGQEFRIPVPVTHQQKLSEAAPGFCIHGPSEPQLGETLVAEAEELIPDIRNLLSEAAVNRAEDFILRAQRGQAVFNAELFHVLQFALAADRDEHPDLTIRLYKSDYFTLQTLNRAFSMIRERDGFVSDLEDSAVRHKLRLFWNGFGLCATVCAIVEDHKTGPIESIHPVLVFGRRGRQVSTNVASGTWHVTANEALTIKDLRDQRISMSDFINRGLHEEAGIDSSDVLRNYVLNVFLSLQEMQPAVNVLSFCRVPDLTSIFHCIAGSQDGRLEYDDYALLPFREADLRSALSRGGLNDTSGHLVPFSPASDNILRCVIARGISSFSY